MKDLVILNEEDEFREVIDLGKNNIYLTEEGFSEDIGIFNKESRMAYITKDIVNKTIYINTSNVKLYGQGFSIISKDLYNSIRISKGTENILIKDFILESKDSNLVIDFRCKNIKIEQVKFIAGNIGVSVFSTVDVIIQNCEFLNQQGLFLRGAKYTTIKSNKFTDVKIGVLLYNYVQNTVIEGNLFLNNEVGVYIFLNSILNIVSKNKFQITKPLLIMYGVRFYKSNSYNKIEENIMSFKNTAFNINEIEMVILICFIYIQGEKNCFNKISENNLVTEKNTFELVVDNNIKLEVYGVEILLENYQNEVSLNNITFKDNNLSIKGKGKIEVLISNILIKNGIKNEIYKNKCDIIGNSFIIEGESIVKNENIILGNGETGAKVELNECVIIGNYISVLDKNSSYKYIANSFRLDEGVKTVELENNLIIIKENSKGEATGIILENKNTGNEISNNRIREVWGNGIVLNKNNDFNFITANTIYYAMCNSIYLINNNNSNVVSDNNIIGKENISLYGILMDIENDSNIIQNNNVKAIKNGVIYGGTESFFNIIRCNNVV